MLHMLYIGSNNESNYLESTKIMRACDQFFPGYTYQEGAGRWNGKSEGCAIVSIVITDGSDGLVNDLIFVLKGVLKQDSILHVSIPCKVEFA